MKTFLIVLSVVIIQGCSSTPPKQGVVYLNDFQEKWKKSELTKCNVASWNITYGLYQQNPSMTKQEVLAIKKKVMDSCILHYGLDI